MNFKHSYKEKRFPKAALFMVVFGVIIIFYFLFDPLKVSFMPRCVFHSLTGLQCMGCGAQRVVHSLLHGDISGAFQANALLTLASPLIIFLLWVEIRRKKNPVLYARIYSPTCAIITASVLVIWFVVRNIIGI